MLYILVTKLMGGPGEFKVKPNMTTKVTGMNNWGSYVIDQV